MSNITKLFLLIRASENRFFLKTVLLAGMGLGFFIQFPTCVDAETLLNTLNGTEKSKASGVTIPNPDFLDKDSFQKAEFFFHSGNDLEAKKQYQKYLDEGLDETYIDQAIFRLAQIEFRGRYYVTSLRYLNYLLEHYPTSSWLTQGFFMVGVCHFELDHLEQARNIFESQLKLNPDNNYRWKSLYYLGRVDEKNLNYVQVIHKLKGVYEQSSDDETRQEAVRVSKRVIDEKLSFGELTLLVQRFKEGFPVGLLLWKLIAQYRLERDAVRYKATLQQFMDLFPHHQHRVQVEKYLSYSRDWSSEPLKLGAILPLTGPKAVIGQQVLQGIQLAFNEMSSLKGTPVKLEVKDSGAVGSFLDAVEELAANPNVLSIIGPVLSAQVKEISSLARNYQVPFITPTASSPGLTDLSPFIFRNALTREIQARYLAQYAVNELNLMRFVVLYPDESFGEELHQVFVEEVRGLGAEVVARISYDRGQTDFKNQILDIGGISDNDLKNITLQKLAQGQEENKNFEGKVPFSKPVIEKGFWNEETVEGLKVSLELSYDAIFIPGFYDKVGLIVPQLIFYNLEQVTLLGTNGWNHPDLLKAAGRFLNNRGIFVDGFFKESKDGFIQNFVREFKSTFGEEPSILSAQAYDAARILLGLIKKGVNKRAQLQSQLFMVKDFPGVSGRTTILPSGESDKKLFALKVRRNKFIQIN